MSSHGSSTRRSGIRVGIAASLSVVMCSGVAFAQEAPGPIEASALAHVSRMAPAPAPPGGGERAAFAGLYAGFAVLQALDAHTTLRAVRAGGREANPLMGGVAGNPAALIAVKAASGLGTIYVVEKLRKKNRLAAAVTMAAINSAYAMIVLHNTRVAGGLPAR